jgi:uncharacterized protein YukE
LRADSTLRVFPPAVVEAAGVARTTSQLALDLGGGLRSLAQGPAAFQPPTGAAFARLSVAWFSELDRIALALSDIGDRAEQAAADYAATDQAAMGLTGSVTTSVSSAGLEAAP